MMHKTVSGEWLVKAGDQGLATAVFARFGGPPDRDGDITEPTAFTDGTAVVVSPWGHSSITQAALPAGKGTIRVRNGRAEVDTEFFLDTQSGRDTFAVVKRLAESGLGEWSYGFDIGKARAGTWSGRPVQILERLHVFEVSPVMRGAGRDTETLATRSDPGIRDLREAAAAYHAKRDAEREFLQFVATSNHLGRR